MIKRKPFLISLTLCQILILSAALSFGEEKRLEVFSGDTEVFRTKYEIGTIALGDPQIASYARNESNPKEIVIMGSTPGSTTITLWDTKGKTRDILRIAVVDKAIHALAEELQKMLVNLEEVKVKIVNSKIILSGEVFKKSSLDIVRRVVRAKPSKDIINNVKISSLALEIWSQELEKLIDIPTVKVKPKGTSAILLLGAVPSERERDWVQKTANSYFSIEEEKEEAEKTGEPYPAEIIQIISFVKVDAFLNERNVAEKIKQMIGIPGIEVEVVADSAYLKGLVKRDSERLLAEEIAGQFYERIINQIKVSDVTMNAALILVDERSATYRQIKYYDIFVTSNPQSLIRRLVGVTGQILYQTEVMVGREEGTSVFVGGPLPSADETAKEKEYGLMVNIYVARMKGQNYIYANLEVEGGIFSKGKKIGDIPGIKFSSFREEEYISPGSSIVLVSMAEASEPRKVLEAPVLKSLPMIGKLFESVVFLTGERKLAGFFWFDFLKADEGGDDLAQAHKTLGVAYMKKGWKDKAIQQFSESLKLNPNQPSLLNLIERLQEELSPKVKKKKKKED